jgi:hypothetical protein
MPKWMSKNQLKVALAWVTTELGIDIRHGAAFLVLVLVVVKRVKELVAKK